MNVIAINASPKASKGASARIIEDFCNVYEEPKSIIQLPIHSDKPNSELYSAFSDLYRDGGAVLLVFPLYLDGLPSHLLRALCSIAEHSCFHGSDEPTYCRSVQIPKIYAAVNCAYFEGNNAEIALEIIKNWSHRIGCEFGGGIGLGGCAGYGMRDLPLIFDGKRHIKKSLSLLANVIKNGENIETQYTSIGYPKRLYRLGAEVGLRAMAHQNHVNLSAKI